MKKVSEDKVRVYSEKVRERVGTLVVNHPVTVASIAVGIYALGYYKGRAQALGKVIRLCTR